MKALLHRYNREYYDDNLQFTVEFRPTKRMAGRYNLEERVITISTHLLTFPRDKVERVLKHELAHAAVHQQHTGEQRPHGDTWQQEMERLGITDPAASHQLQLVEPAYRFECRGCGATIGRHRRSKFVKHYEQYTCSNCGGSFRQTKP